ncbi:hypothetical protein ACFL5P_00505 [candidate division KSB1 bacterium]
MLAKRSIEIIIIVVFEGIRFLRDIFKDDNEEVKSNAKNKAKR